jgi:hypothetical protein
MDHRYEALIRMLEDEKTLGKELLELLKKKKDAVVRLDRQEADLLLPREEFLVGQIRRAMDGRKKAVVELARQLRVPPEGLRLLDVAVKAPNPFREKMLALREDILAVSREIDRYNAATSKLLERFMGHVRTIMGIIANSRSAGVYGPMRKAVPQAGLLDRTA